MKRCSFFATLVAVMLAASPAFAADKAAKQAEIRKATAASLEKFYK